MKKFWIPQDLCENHLPQMMRVKVEFYIGNAVQFVAGIALLSVPLFDLKYDTPSPYVAIGASVAFFLFGKIVQGIEMKHSLSMIHQVQSCAACEWKPLDDR